jgi:hypothetical protein
MKHTGKGATTGAKTSTKTIKAIATTKGACA